MKELFVVYRQGVYIQAIIGVFDDLENAIKCGVVNMENESDDYHDFCINNIYLNTSFQSADTDRSFEIVFNDIGIYTVKIDKVQDTTYGITSFVGGYAGEVKVIRPGLSETESEESLTSWLFTALGLLVIAIIGIYSFKRYIWEPLVAPKMNLTGGVINATPKSYAKKKT